MTTAELIAALYAEGKTSQALRMAESHQERIMEDAKNGERIYGFPDGSRLEMKYTVHSMGVLHE